MGDEYNIDFRENSYMNQFSIMSKIVLKFRTTLIYMFFFFLNTDEIIYSLIYTKYLQTKRMLPCNEFLYKYIV